MDDSFDIPLLPIIARIGGKTQMVKKLLVMIPPHDTYVELFCGGASLFFKKLLSKNNVINDIDTDIINIYKDIKDIKNIDDLVIYSDEINKQLFNTLKNKITFNNKKERLFRNLLLSKLSFSGNRKTFGFSEIKGCPQFINLKKYYNNYRYKLLNTTILNDDFVNVINTYDNKNTFFFLDPPYSELKKSWGYNNLSITADELFKILSKIKGKFLMTYDYNLNNINLFKTKFNVYEIETLYCLNNKGKAKEIIITNY